MPQELRVVSCCSCETYQVDIVKKTSNWKCKMCNLKQSLQKVNYIGSGNECRTVTQELNKRRVELGMQKDPIITTDYIRNNDLNKNDLTTANKWEEYLSDYEVVDMDMSSDEEEEASGYDYAFRAFMKEQGCIVPHSKQHEQELIDKFKTQNEKTVPRKSSKMYCKSEFPSQSGENIAASSDFKENRDVNIPTTSGLSFYNANEDISDILDDIIS